MVLRDLIVAQGHSKPLRCLYLTKGGLLDDVRLKLQSVIPGVDSESIVQVEKSFVEYGTRTDGIHIASIDAARRYVKKAQKKRLPTGVEPEILIIDEAHHCASEDELTKTLVIRAARYTRAIDISRPSLGTTPGDLPSQSSGRIQYRDGLYQRDAIRYGQDTRFASTTKVDNQLLRRFRET